MTWILVLIIAGFVAFWVWDRTRPANGLTSFGGKVIVITGASSGIGMATARKFAGMGTKLVLVARRGDVLDEMKQALSNVTTEVLPVSADITRMEDVQRLIDTIQATYGRIDVLINNAGIVDTEPLDNLSAERINAIMDINLIAPINLTRLALPLMRGSVESGVKQAHIVNVSSTVGLTRVPRQATYSASKAGLNGFTDAMRRELNGTGIGVSMILPGLVNTAMLGDFKSRDEALQMLKDSGMGIPGVYLNEPDEVADTIIDAIRYNRHEVILGGWMFVLLSWMGRHTPRLLDSVYTQMFKTESLQENVKGKA